MEYLRKMVEEIKRPSAIDYRNVFLTIFVFLTGCPLDIVRWVTLEQLNALLTTGEISITYTLMDQQVLWSAQLTSAQHAFLKSYEFIYTRAVDRNKLTLYFMGSKPDLVNPVAASQVRNAIVSTLKSTNSARLLDSHLIA